MTFIPVDYFFCILILIFALLGLCRGFVSAVFGKAALIAGLICAAFFYKKIIPVLAPKVSNQLMCTILSFLIVFAVVFLIVKICEMIFQKLFENKLLGSLNRALGLLFGFVEGLAIVFVIIFVLNVQPFVETGNLLQGSFFYHLLGIVASSDVVRTRGGKI